MWSVEYLKCAPVHNRQVKMIVLNLYSSTNHWIYIDSLSDMFVCNVVFL